jgi:hypothetical protein
MHSLFKVSLHARRRQSAPFSFFLRQGFSTNRLEYRSQMQCLVSTMMRSSKGFLFPNERGG